MNSIDNYVAKRNELLNNIKANLPELEKLLEEADSYPGAEDLVYRYYVQSLKV